MGSGKPPAPEASGLEAGRAGPRDAGTRSTTRAPKLLSRLLAIALLAACGSCGQGGTAGGGAPAKGISSDEQKPAYLARLDAAFEAAAGAPRPPESRAPSIAALRPLFAKAYLEAEGGRISLLFSALGLPPLRPRSATAWLGILRRAGRAEGLGDRGRLAEASARASAAALVSEEVAAAAARGLARGGRPVVALELFDRTLKASSWPDLLVEIIQSCAASGSLPAGRPKPDESFLITERFPALAPEAAALLLEEGDPGAARDLIRQALGNGVAVPPALLWDCGLYRELAARPDTPSASELALMGDAAWMIGDQALAEARWRSSISLSPGASWKSYAKLAFLPSSKGRKAADLMERMRGIFMRGPVPDPGALRAYSLFLLQEGREAEVLHFLDPASNDVDLALLALVVLGRRSPEERYVAEALRFAESREGDATALAAGLRILFERGRMADMAVLRRSGEKRGLSYPYDWYYRAADLVATGDLEGAAALLEKEGPSRPGPEAAFALALVYRAMALNGDALPLLIVARDSAKDGRLRCEILKELGRNYAAMGDTASSHAAFQAAAMADPDDPEASLLSRSSGPR